MRALPRGGTDILMGILPVCGELLWVDIFATTNTAFCCLSLFQSAFNIMIETMDEDHLGAKRNTPSRAHPRLLRTACFISHC